MLTYARPERSEIIELREEVSSGIQKLLDKDRVRLSKIYLLREEVEALFRKKVRRALSSISVREFQKYFPYIKLPVFETRGIYHLASLVDEVKDNPYSIPGVMHGYEPSLVNYLKDFQETIEDRVNLNFDLDGRSLEEEKILRILYEIDVKEKFYIDVDMKRREWQEKLRPVEKYMDPSIFWRFTWRFRSDASKEKVLESIDLYRGILQDMSLYGVGKREADLNREIGEFDVWEDFRENSSKYYALLENVLGRDISEDKLSGSLNSQLVEEVNKLELNKDNLKVKLRSWQEFGAKFTLKQKKVLIGDEMGLGKTIEAIAVMADLKSKDRNKFLVVCPASLITNWFREVEKHSNLRPMRLHGKDRDQSTKDWLSGGGVGISSYSTIQKLNLPRDIEIDLLVLDEAHYVKNKDAKRSRFAYYLTEKSEYTMYMTGTPIENSLQEMLNLISKLNEDVIEELERNPINYFEDLFRETMGPVYLRRNRKDVLNELPELTQIEEWVEFSKLERDDYIKNIKANNFMGLRRSGFAGRTRAKSPKINRILEIVEESIANGNKVIIFSFFRDVISSLEKELGGVCVGTITGGVYSSRRGDILDEFQESESKNVLVAQIDAAGVGLNIQQANTVIICEPQLKPSTETQAISRVYRMGQVKNVFVYRILTEDSIDEMLMDLLDTKQYVFDTYARKSFTGDASLKKEDGKVIKIQEYIMEKERKKYANIL